MGIIGAILILNILLTAKAAVRANKEINAEGWDLFFALTIIYPIMLVIMGLTAYLFWHLLIFSVIVPAIFAYTLPLGWVKIMAVQMLVSIFWPSKND